MGTEFMNNEISEILSKIFNGDSTAEERRKLIDWMEEDPNNAKILGDTEAIWLATGILKNHEGYNHESAYKHFTEKIQAAQGGKGKVYKFTRRKLLQMAAIIILPLFVSIYAINVSQKTEYVSNRIVQITTPKGGRTQITLPDGTKIWLNSESKLEYPEIFKGKTREVSLIGEGYFAVAKDKKHPFIVKTSDISIKALGTEFNVKCYPGEGTIETTLVEGSVAVSKNQDGEEATVLKKNGRATFIKKDGNVMLTEKEKEKINLQNNVPLTSISSIKELVIVSEKINTDQFTAWKSNKLLFDNEIFESIAYKLERRYGCTILFEDKKVRKYCFSGRFDEISIEQALKALQYASSFKYRIDNDTVRILSENTKY